jgi:hypothetical protein
MFEAGERVQGRIPPVVDNPTVEGMLNQIFGEVQTPAAVAPENTEKNSDSDIPPTPEA